MAMLKERSERAFALVERRLGEAPYFTGNELTGADVMMLFPLSTMRPFAERDLSTLPNIGANVEIPSVEATPGIAVRR